MEKLARITINYDPEGSVHGIKMWSSEGEKLLQVGEFNFTNYDIRLQKGQRIVGLKSR
jgi:hypothetical protein